MSEQFETGLRELHEAAAHAHAAGAGFATAALAARVRRHRRLRAAAVTATTTAVVAGLVVAGAALLRPDEAPIPPALSATPTPTQTSATDAGPLASEEVCGTAVGDLPVLTDAPLTLEVTLDPPSLAPGGTLDGTVVLAAVDPPGPTVINDVVHELRYLVVDDGVVVGVGRDGGGAPVTPLSGRDGVAHEFAVTLTACATDATDATDSTAGSDSTAGTELVPGDHELYVGLFAEVSGVAGTRVLLGGPWPFTVD